MASIPVSLDCFDCFVVGNKTDFSCNTVVQNCFVDPLIVVVVVVDVVDDVVDDVLSVDLFGKNGTYCEIVLNVDVDAVNNIVE